MRAELPFGALAISLQLPTMERLSVRPMQPAATPTLANHPPEGAPTREIIAIVDDDPGLSQALGAWLEFHGWRATHHISGESLLQHTHLQDDTVLVEVGVTAPVRFRLLGAVIDLNLPGISGIDTARKLRHMSPALPIVLVTALGPDERQHYGALPARVQCVQKPFSLDALEAALQPLIDTRQNPTITPC